MFNVAVRLLATKCNCMGRKFKVELRQLGNSKISLWLTIMLMFNQSFKCFLFHFFKNICRFLLPLLLMDQGNRQITIITYRNVRVFTKEKIILQNI